MVYKEFIVRSPAFPLEFFFDANRISEKGHSDLIGYVERVLNNPKFKQAIFFASQDLYRVMPKFLLGEMTKKEALKYSIAIFKYISRSSSRSTPFGAFAGIDIGSLGQHSTINLPKSGHSKLRVRFDTTLENHLLSSVLTQKETQNLITFSLNDTIYRVKDDVRFYEKKDIGNKIDYVISSVPNEEHIASIIEMLQPGFSKRDFFELMSDFSDDMEEIQSFFDELISNSFILPDLQHYLTGKDLLTELLVLLKPTIGTTECAFPWLQKLVYHINDFNFGIQDHEQLLGQVYKNLPSPPVGNYFQADLDLNFDRFSLSNKVLDRLVVQIKQILSKLAYREKNMKLSRFAQKFQEHFGEREISLLVAIDPELGISYDENEGLVSPLLEGLELYHIDNQDNDRQGRNCELNAFMNKIAQKSIVNGFSEVVLEEKDLKELEEFINNDPDLANEEFYILGSIICSATEEFDKENFLFDLKVVANSSATKLGSRFGYLKDDVKTWNKELYKSTNELDNDGVVAEIVHLPDYTAGNVLKRPTLSDYEIPFFASSSVPPENRIALGDLYVSVRNQKIILRSKKLGKIVYPKLTSAHNFRNGIPIYHFLSDLQQQDVVVGMNNIWKIPAGAVYSPRIRFRNLVLNKATWRITNSDFEGKTIEDFENFYVNFTGQYQVPKLVTLTQFDNEILLNTDNWVSKQIIFETLRSQKTVLLTEFLQGEGATLIKGEDGNFCNEVLFQVLRRDDKDKKNKTSIISSQVTKSQHQRFFPGDEWLYIKIYSGPRTLDDILIKEISLIVSKLCLDRDDIKIFFIRYYDPNSHLRFRIYCKDKDYLYSTALKQIREILSPLTLDDTVHKIQFDTYEPEIVRYGSEIERSEQVFHSDSILCIKCLSYLKSMQLDSNVRIYLGVLFIKNYLDDFFNSVDDKYYFCQLMKNGYYMEYAAIPNLKQMLAEKRRTYKELFNHYESEEGSKTIINTFNGFLKERQIAVKEIPSYGSDPELLKSYIHMSINRLFNEKQRLQELFLYDYVERDFLSVLKTKKIKR